MVLVACLFAVMLFNGQRVMRRWRLVVDLCATGDAVSSLPVSLAHCYIHSNFVKLENTNATHNTSTV
jgi:hypothetical protein